MTKHILVTNLQTDRGDRTHFSDGDTTVRPTHRPTAANLLNLAFAVVIAIAVAFGLATNPDVQRFVAWLVAGG